MSHTPVIGDARFHRLIITQGLPLEFDVEWWVGSVTDKEPVAIASLVSRLIEEETETTLINLGAYTTIGGAGSNILQVRVPDALTGTPFAQARWYIEATAVDPPQPKLLAYGPGIYRRTG